MKDDRYNKKTEKNGKPVQKRYMNDDNFTKNTKRRTGGKEQN